MEMLWRKLKVQNIRIPVWTRVLKVILTLIEDGYLPRIATFLNAMQCSGNFSRETLNVYQPTAIFILATGKLSNPTLKSFAFSAASLNNLRKRQHITCIVSEDCLWVRILLMLKANPRFCSYQRHRGTLL